MPAKFTKTYTSEAEYLYDVATTSDLFDRDLFNELNTKGDGVEFLRAIAGTKNKKSDTFDKEKYNLLHGEDKVNYLVREYYTEDKTSKEYLDSKKYFDAKIAEAIDEKYYTSLTGFQKTIRTIGGMLGNMLNSAWSTVEGLIDLGAYAIEGTHRLMGDEEQARLWREAALLDTTGARRFQHTLDNFAKRNSAVNRSAFLSGVNDVLTGITQMAPMLAGYALAPVTGGTSIAAGTAVYYGAMAGNTINEELTKNPNINYFKLLAYTAASTGTEMAIESLSGKTFGSTFIDTLAGLNTTKAAVGSLLKRTGLSMLSEGLEEGVAEILGSLTYQIMMDPNAPSATWGDVFYAALIGGLIGGVMEVGGVATSTRYVTTKKDGQLITLAEAKAEGLKPEQYEKVSKIKSSDLFNRMTAYVERSEEQTEVDKLLAKYNTKYNGNVTVETLKQNHKSEYDIAVSKDAEFSEKTAEMVAGLSALIEKIGIQSFNKAAELLNYEFESQQERIDMFVAEFGQKDLMFAKVKQEFERENEGHTINVYNYAQYTQNEKYLAGAIEKLTGKKVAFVKHGSKDGSAFSDVASTEHYVYIEKGVTDKMGTTQVYDKIVKQQLVNEIVNTPGFITSAEYRVLHDAVMPVGTEYKELKKQAKEYLMENVLFDEITNKRLLRMKFPLFAKLFNKITKKANETRLDKKISTEEKRIAYSSLLKTRRTFLNNAISVLHHPKDIDVASRVMSLSLEEKGKFSAWDGTEDAPENPVKTMFFLTDKLTSRASADLSAFEDEIIHMIKPEELAKTKGFIYYARLLDESYYKDWYINEFYTSLEERGIDDQSFVDMIWHTARKYNFVLLKDGRIARAVTYSSFVKKSLLKDLKDVQSGTKTALDAFSKYKTLSDVFGKEKLNEILPFGLNPNAVRIKWFEDENTDRHGYVAVFGTKYYEINWNVLADPDAVLNTIYHELTHVFNVAIGAPPGTNPDECRIFVNKMSPKLFERLAKDFGIDNYWGIETHEDKVDFLSYKLYQYNAGEQMARGEYSATSPDYDSFYIDYNYKNMTVSLTGTGRFKKIKITLDVDEYRKKLNGKNVSESRTLGIQSELDEKGVKNYEEAGFSKAFVEELTTNSRLNKEDIVEFINNNEVGTEEATNKVIKFYWPNNKNIKTIETAKKWFDKTRFFNQYRPFDVAYAYYLLKGDDDRFNQKKKLTLKEMALEVLCVEKNGKLVKDNKKATENAAMFAAAQELTEKEENKHSLYTGILDADTALTLESIGKLVEKLAKGLGWVSDSGTYGFTEVSDTVKSSDDGDSKSLSDYSQLGRWYEERVGKLEELSKENPENYDYEKEIKAIEKIKSLEDDEAHSRFKEEFGGEFEDVLDAAKTTAEAKTIETRMTEILAEVENEIETMFLEKGTDIEKRVADDMLYYKENNSQEKKEKLLKQTENKILIRQKELFEEYFKTEKADTEKLNDIVLGKELIEQNKLGTSFTQKELDDLVDKYTNPQIVIDAFSKVINDENADNIYNKINSTEGSSRFKRIYGEEKFEKIKKALKELLPTEKSNDTKAIEERRKKLKAISQKLTMEEKIFVRESKAKANSPLERQEYLDGLNKLLVKYGLASEKQTKQVKVSKYSKEVLDKFKEITNEDYYSLIENGDEKQIENANKIIEDIVSEEKSQKQPVEKKEALKVVIKTLDEIEPMRQKQTKTFKDIGVELNDKKNVVLKPYNKNKSPLENGFNLTDFLFKYVPQDWNSHSYSVVKEKKLYYAEKMRNKNAIDELLKLAIINNPDLTIETIMNDLGYEYDKKDFAELETTIAKLKESKKKTAETLKKRQNAKKKQPVAEQETKTVTEPQKDVKETVEKPKQTKKPDAVVETKAKSPVVKKEQEKVVKPSDVVEEIDEEKEFAQPPEEMPELTKEEKQKAKEQELKITEMKFDKKTQNKVKELLAMMPKEVTSDYKGDYYHPTYVSASKRTIDNNEEFFKNITSEEYQIMRVLLFAEQNEVGDAALVLLDRYAYIKRNSQFKDIAEFIRWNNKRRASTAGSFLGSMSATYGNRTARTFVKELEIKNKTNIEFTDKEVSSVLGEDKESFVEKTIDEIEKLDKQLKNTKDPYEKHKIQQEIDAKNALLDAVEDNDVASVVDVIAKTLDDTDHDQIKNQEKIAKLYSSMVSLAIAKQQEIMAEPAIIGKTGESKVLTALRTLKSFRYLCMLSSPTTWGKNALANTASSAQAIVEDTAAKFLENREKWFLKSDTQVNFTGEYNKEFSDYVEKQYKDKILRKTKGTKYTETALDELRLAYAEATDPLTKSKILSKIKAVEQKMLSDTPWTSRRTMRNLKNMLAGATPQILLQVEYKLKSMYRGKSRIADLTHDTLIKNMKDKNSELLELYIDATNKDSKTSMLSILQLGEKLEVDLLNSDNKNNIFNMAVYRANKLLLKVDNWLTKLRSDLRKKHPVAVELLDFVIPFARTTINTTSYVIDRSPYGLIKGIITALQTRQAQVNDMLKIIENHYKDVYTREVKKTLKDGETFKFDNDKFIKWFETNVDESIRKTLKNTKDKKQIIELYNKMVEDGQIPRGLVLNTNPYARAFAIEQIAQGATGTAVLALGVILAAVADAFEYEDDDDYMGAIIRIGDWKIALNTLTPFSTLFTIGTMLSSGKIDNNLEAAFEVFVDSTILSIVGSAIQYSDNFTDFVKNQTINGLQQYIPAAFKPITKLIDPAKKDKTGSFAEKLIKTSMSNIPGLSYLVPNKINPYTGKTEKYYEKGFLEALFNIAPVNFRIEDQSELEQTAITLDNKTTGLAGRFEINNKRYDLSGAEKEKYSKYRAEYINKQYNDIVKNGKKVTVKDKNGKLITTTFNKLTNEQKSNVLSSIYSEATSKTRIKYWLDSGNKYYTSNREEYLELRKLFNTTNIRYNNSWKKSKFVEG